MRTPGPLPLVNSIPADSKARLSAVTVEPWAAKMPRADLAEVAGLRRG